ncbi:diguanylate cyclase [Paraburkholderia sp. CI3]|uniref:GGDEF domain-containing protein n=1 Tax=Paraburkholderia sp. CI3 TaxID=2991060 RepID=UPI003D23D9A8
MWLINRERQLHERVQRFAGTVSTIVQHMPTPVAVVDLDTQKILLANEALLAEFGAVAGAGQPFPRLLVDAANWPEMCTTPMDEGVPMLARDGTRHMLLRCTQLESVARETASGTLLVTLVDVTHQHQLLKQLRTEADFDVLTGLANRRFFEKAAQKAVAHARQQSCHLTVLALDLDFFKRVNDSYGHAAGDRVLQVVARLFEGVLRETDLAARLGGEEFAAILLDSPLEQAQAVAERIRITVQNTPILLEAGQTISQTVSIGIAAYREGEADLVLTQKRADAALYSAKAEGRNRVQIYVSEAPA